MSQKEVERDRKGSVWVGLGNNYCIMSIIINFGQDFDNLD